MSMEQSIIERLEALEKQNRWLKRMGATVIMVAAALMLMGQAVGKRTIEANEFVLRDSAGKVRSKWTMDPGISSQGIPEFPVLSLLDNNGKERMELALPNRDGDPGLFLSDAAESTVLSVDAFGTQAAITLWGAPGNDGSITSKVILAKDSNGGWLNLYNNYKSEDRAADIRLDARSDRPSLTVQDREGFQATIGGADLKTTRTGETSRTSAASMTLFGKDGKVLWKAP